MSQLPMSWSCLFNNSSHHLIEADGELRLKEARKEERRYQQNEKQKNDRLGLDIPTATMSHRARSVRHELPPLPPLASDSKSLQLPTKKKRRISLPTSPAGAHVRLTEGDANVESSPSIKHSQSLNLKPKYRKSAREDPQCTSALTLAFNFTPTVTSAKVIDSVTSRSSSHRQRPIRSNSTFCTARRTLSRVVESRLDDIIKSNDKSISASLPIESMVRMSEILPTDRDLDNSQPRQMESLDRPPSRESECRRESDVAITGTPPPAPPFSSFSLAQSQQQKNGFANSNQSHKSVSVQPKAVVRTISDSESEPVQIKVTGHLPSMSHPKFQAESISLPPTLAARRRMVDSSDKQIMLQESNLNKSTNRKRDGFFLSSSASSRRSQRQSDLLNASHGLDNKSMRLNPFPQARTINDMLLGMVHAGCMSESDAFHPSEQAMARAQCEKWDKQGVERPFGSPVKYPQARAKEQLQVARSSKSQLLEEQRYLEAGFQLEPSQDDTLASDDGEHNESSEHETDDSEYRDSQ